MMPNIFLYICEIISDRGKGYQPREDSTVVNNTDC